MDLTTNEIINYMFGDIIGCSGTERVTEWAILIHASIINQFKNKWQKLSKNDDWNAVAYTLQIGSKCYEMFLVVVPIDIDNNDDDERMFQWSAIRNSQFSFPWEEEPTLFINVESFHVMEEFIRNHNLQGYIFKIEDKPGITWNDGIIKVLTFSKSVDMELDIIQEYNNHLFTRGRNDQPTYYYLTNAFSWLHPRWRERFKIPDDCYKVFPIIFNHLRTLNYINELNLFDLLSIRLALCDDRNPSPSHLLKFDIDFMIKRKLAKIVRNNHLDLDQYFIDKNYQMSKFLMDYLVYEFQHLFKTVKTYDIYSSFQSGLVKLNTFIKLADAHDVLNIIKQKSNIDFDIDGSSYDQMSLSLFLDLIECHNVMRFKLDTNYRWINDECNLNRDIPNLNRIDVELTGTNIYNFVEEFISSLKTVTFQKPESARILLSINGNINDYTIFDNLTVHDIDLHNVKIDTHMLQDLHKCNLKSTIAIDVCIFESTRQNWALLNNLGELIRVGIREDEGTWEPLFEFVLEEMRKTNSKEFRFYHERVAIRSGDINIILEHYKFTVDELNSKLEIRNRDTNEIIDLFEEKCRLQVERMTIF